MRPEGGAAAVTAAGASIVRPLPQPSAVVRMWPGLQDRCGRSGRRGGLAEALRGTPRLQAPAASAGPCRSLRSRGAVFAYASNPASSVTVNGTALNAGSGCRCECSCSGSGRESCSGMSGYYHAGGLLRRGLAPAAGPAPLATQRTAVGAATTVAPPGPNRAAGGCLHGDGPHPLPQTDHEAAAVVGGTGGGGCPIGGGGQEGKRRGRNSTEEPSAANTGSTATPVPAAAEAAIPVGGVAANAGRSAGGPEPLRRPQAQAAGRRPQKRRRRPPPHDPQERASAGSAGWGAAAALAPTRRGQQAEIASSPSSSSDSHSNSPGSSSRASPADLTRAIKACRSAAELHRIFHEGAGSRAGGGGGGAGLNDLHLVALLTHLAQLEGPRGQRGSHGVESAAATAGKAARPAAAVDRKSQAGGREPAAAGPQGGRSSPGVPARGGADAAAFGCEVAAVLGARAAAGSPVLRQPRAASNAMWAAAKLGLRMRASWWEEQAAALALTLPSRGAGTAVASSWASSTPSPFPLSPSAATGPPQAAGPRSRNSSVQAVRWLHTSAPSPSTAAAAAGAVAGGVTAQAVQGPSGRDLSNALYALGLAVGVRGGGGGPGGAGGGGGDAVEAASSVVQPFVRRLRALGQELLEACSEPVLRTCQAQELSCLLYGAALLRLSPPPGWLAVALGPALVAALPNAGPQVVSNVLWALQELAGGGAEPGADAAGTRLPAAVWRALLDRSRGMLQSTAREPQLQPPAQHEQPLPRHDRQHQRERGCGEQAVAESPAGQGQAHEQALASSPSPFSSSLPLPPPAALPVDLLATTVWSVGRIAAASTESSGGGVPPPDHAWQEAAAGAITRLLLHHLRSADTFASAQAGGAGGGGAGAGWTLSPRSLAALASGVSLLLRCRGTAAGGEGRGPPLAGLWPLIFASAARMLPPKPTRSSAAVNKKCSTAGGGGGGGGGAAGSWWRWDPRDVYELLAAAAEVGPGARASQRELVEALPQLLLLEAPPPPAAMKARGGKGLAREGVAKATAGNGRRGGAGSSTSACGGGGGGCSDAVLVGCVWALARLRYNILPLGVRSTLALAARGRMSRLHPVQLTQLLWALGALGLGGGRPGALGLERRVRLAVARLVPLHSGEHHSGDPGGQGGHQQQQPVAGVGVGVAVSDGAGAAGAADRCAAAPPAAGTTAAVASPLLSRQRSPPLGPWGVVQLLVALAALEVQLAPQLCERVALQLAAPAVRQLTAQLRSLGRHGAGQQDKHQEPAGRQQKAQEQQEKQLREAVRLLGALTSALAGLVPAVAGPGWRGNRDPLGSRSGCVRPRLSLRVRAAGAGVDGGCAGGGTVVRRLLWEAGSQALSAGKRLRQHDGSSSEAVTAAAVLLPVRDLSAYLAGLRRLRCPPRASLAAPLLAHLHLHLQLQLRLDAHRPAVEGQQREQGAASGGGGSGGRQLPSGLGAACNARELVGLACEVSYLATAAPGPQQRQRAARLRALAPRGPAGSPQAAGEDPPAVHQPTPQQQAEPCAPPPPVSGARPVSLAARRHSHSLRQRVQAVTRSRVGPALLRAVRRLAETELKAGAAAAASASAASTSSAAAASGLAAPLSLSQAATLLAALRRLQRRLRLQSDPGVMVALLRASAAALRRRSVVARVGGGGGPAAAAAACDLSEVVRLAAAVAAALPALPEGPGQLGGVPAGAGSSVATTHPIVLAHSAGARAAGGALEVAEAEAVSRAASEWLASLAAAVEAAAVSSPPVALLESVLPAVGELAAVAGRAPWMRDTVQNRILPAAYAVCGHMLLVAPPPPLPYLCRLLDRLLLLAQPHLLAAEQQLQQQRPGWEAGGHAAPQPPAPDSASCPAASLPLPDPLWLAVFRGSFRRMAAALMQPATGQQQHVKHQRHQQQQQAQQQKTDWRAKAGRGRNPSGRRGWSLAGPDPSAFGSHGGGYSPGGGGSGGGVSARQLVSLAYSMARHPPPRPPPAQWMKLLLQGIEADLGSLGARDCADLCVALVRLRCVPGGSWLRAFMRQVDTTAALTERTEHALLSEAWLQLRRFSAAGGQAAQRQGQRQGQQQGQGQGGQAGQGPQRVTPWSRQ